MTILTNNKNGKAYTVISETEKDYVTKTENGKTVKLDKEIVAKNYTISEVENAENKPENVETVEQPEQPENKPENAENKPENGNGNAATVSKKELAEKLENAFNRKADAIAAALNFVPCRNENVAHVTKYKLFGGCKLYTRCGRETVQILIAVEDVPENMEHSIIKYQLPASIKLAYSNAGIEQFKTIAETVAKNAAERNAKKAERKAKTSKTVEITAEQADFLAE